MKKLTILNLFFTLIFVSFSTKAIAQENNEAKRLLNAYIDASNSLEETQNIDNVLSLFSKNYKSNISYLGLSGVVKNSTVNYEQFSEQLSENLKNSNYKFIMSVDQIIYESQNMKFGTISATVNFESKIDGETAEKGKLLMNVVVTNDYDVWKIVHSNTLRVSEAKDIGNCFCNIFSNGDMFFNAETYYPNGVEYGIAYKTYRISFKDGVRRIVNRNDNRDVYLWKEDGGIYKKDEKVGFAKDNEKAVQEVLSYLYSKSCTKINFG